MGEFVGAGQEQKISFPVYFYLLAVILGCIISFILLESFLRIFMPQMLHDECYGAGLTVFDEKLGTVLKPAASICGYGYDTHKRIKYTTNNAGFRMLSDVSVNKTKGTKRIMLFGDSFTFGVGLDDREIFSYLLSEFLPDTYEVINGGVSGTGTGQQFALLKESRLKYEPDVVIVFFYPNDLNDNVGNYPKFVPFGEDKVFPFPIPPPAQPQKSVVNKKFLARYSHSAEFFYNKYDYFRLSDVSFKNKFIDGVYTFLRRLKNAPPMLDSTLLSMSSEYDKSMQTQFMLQFALFSELQKLSKEYNFHLTVFNIPSYMQFEIDETKESLKSYFPAKSELVLVKDKQNILFANFFKQKNISFVDLFYDGDFSANYKKMYFKEDGHLSPFGAKVVAKVVYDKLISDGVINVTTLALAPQ
ncbi:SGNH/GDSL hydrolase family protein [Candidatus Woesearchaeota archaeon]|nr:SGNH/GDSL hydrolase family protein [Candidatus Woesearchaeota archaeon]